MGCGGGGGGGSSKNNNNDDGGGGENRPYCIVSFETNGVWKQFDPELPPTILRYIAEAGRLFARRIEEIV